MENKPTTEQYLVKKIKNDFDYWQGYIQSFEDKDGDFEKNKKEVVSRLKENPEDKSILDELEHILYDKNIHIQDLNQLSSYLIAEYKNLLALDLTDELPQDLNKTMHKLLDTERKQLFIVDKDGFKERVKGKKKEYIDSLKESPQYKTLIQTLEKALADE